MSREETFKKFKRAMAAIMAGLAEFPKGHYCPRSYAMLACELTADEYYLLEEIGEAKNVAVWTVNHKAHTLTLTDKGYEMGQAVNQIIVDKN